MTGTSACILEAVWMDSVSVHQALLANTAKQTLMSVYQVPAQQMALVKTRRMVMCVILTLVVVSTAMMVTVSMVTASVIQDMLVCCNVQSENQSFLI